MMAYEKNKGGNMSEVFLLLGKNGDLLSVAPILQQRWNETGQCQNLMVASDYLETAKRLIGVNPVVFDGNFQDLRHAMRQAKRDFSKVTVLQVFGRDIVIQKQTPSFQHDQWIRGKATKGFCKWPLLIRNGTNEFVNKPKGRLVLFADVSESSPFVHREELAKLIQETLPEHTLVRLSEFKLDNICDFLPLYDAAELIVSIETAHLHLTRATTTPVIALVTDQPSRWHGSAWHPRYRLHCRYGDFLKRQQELKQAMLDVTQDVEPINEKVSITGNAPYNPSVILRNGELLTAFRCHQRNDWRTRILLWDQHELQEIEMPMAFHDLSIEDGRLFYIKGRLMLSYVVASAANGNLTAIIGYGELINNGGWRIAHHYQPRFGRNDGSAMEKNWVPFDVAGKLHFIYGSQPEQTIIEVDGDKVVKTHASPGISWPYGEIRGGCIVPYDGKLLRFFHSHTNTGPRESWIYRIGAALMNAQPPFETIKVCDRPILAANEKWSNIRHWKQNIIFPGGVIPLLEGGWGLSVGLNDCECALLQLNWKDLHL
jgi:predicted GH43/DUF377 family glycosyl hydrolase